MTATELGWRKPRAKKIELVKGKVRWYYRVVAGNGEPILVSQHYWSRSNAKREAQRQALIYNCDVVEKRR